MEGINLVKCGFMIYEEFNNPYYCVYTCKYFGFSVGVEKILCAGCTIDNKGIPHIPEFEEEEEE